MDFECIRRILFGLLKLIAQQVVPLEVEASKVLKLILAK
jgi:hypothetical protein